MENLSDTQIRANLRSVLAHHKVDLNKTSFVCTRGVVRMVGELEKQQAFATQGLSSGDVESLEQDLSRVRGVIRVHMEFKNWLRETSGSWKEKGRPKKREEPSVEETLKALTETRLLPVDAYFASKRRRELEKAEKEESEKPTKIPRRPA